MLHYRYRQILSTGIWLWAMTQAADGAELPQDLIDCRALTSAVARLDCYDQAIDAHGAATSESPEGTTARPADPPPVAATAAARTVVEEPAGEISQEALFGKNMVEVKKSVQEATGSNEIDQIQATVTRLRSSATRKAIITLDNDQVWTQIDNSRLRLSVDDKVTIRRASMGSFLLYKSGRKSSMRVKRIS
jgi:hypothetical protein